VTRTATALVPIRPTTARPVRWLAASLLVVTAAIHLALFPSHAGLVDEAAAHPKPKPQPEATTATSAPAPLQLGRGRPEPQLPSAPAGVAPAPYMSPSYIGWLFLVGAAVSLVAARRVVRDDSRWGWMLGAAVCAAMSAGLLAARTVGLPGGYSEGGSLEGQVTLAVQAGFLVLAAWRLTRRGIMVRWG
jgi:hypothetical protein